MNDLDKQLADLQADLDNQIQQVQAEIDGALGMSSAMSVSAEREKTMMEYHIEIHCNSAYQICGTFIEDADYEKLTAAENSYKQADDLLEECWTNFVWCNPHSCEFELVVKDNKGNVVYQTNNYLSIPSYQYCRDDKKFYHRFFKSGNKDDFGSGSEHLLGFSFEGSYDRYEEECRIYNFLIGKYAEDNFVLNADFEAEAPFNPSKLAFYPIDCPIDDIDIVNGLGPIDRLAYDGEEIWGEEDYSYRRLEDFEIVEREE